MFFFFSPETVCNSHSRPRLQFPNTLWQISCLLPDRKVLFPDPAISGLREVCYWNCTFTDCHEYQRSSCI